MSQHPPSHHPPTTDTNGRDVFPDCGVHPNLPVITVITVVLNGRRHIEQTIHSVIDQKYPRLEYIIIDGGSSDGTLDVIRCYESAISCWSSGPDNGIYDAMNKGIARAHGDLIALLNSDDYYEPGALQAVADTYLRHSGASGLYYGSSFVIHDDLQMRYAAPANCRHWCGMGYFHPAMFATRDVYERVGLYPIAYRYAADYDFLLTALDRGIAQYPVDAMLVNYRSSGLSAVHAGQTLREIRIINGCHFPALSMAHVSCLLLCAKSILLLTLERVVNVLAGPAVLQRLRRIYLTKVIARHAPSHEV